MRKSPGINEKWYEDSRYAGNIQQIPSGIVIILTLFIIVVLIVGLLQTIYEIKEFLFKRPIGQSFNVIVVDILTFLVIIELFRGFVSYFEVHRFRLSTMIDPAIVFVIRELIVKLYGEENLGWQNIAAFGFLLLCLGIIRSLAVIFSPGDEVMPSRTYPNI
jgi:uncharacterized membrane protein (DUF373 family)